MMHKYNKKKFVSKTAIQVARMIAKNDDESILPALYQFDGSKTATLMRLHAVDYFRRTGVYRCERKAESGADLMLINDNHKFSRMKTRETKLEARLV